MADIFDGDFFTFQRMQKIWFSKKCRQVQRDQFMTWVKDRFHLEVGSPQNLENILLTWPYLFISIYSIFKADWKSCGRQ